MSLVDAVVSRLNEGKPPWKAVNKLAALSQLESKSSGLRTPALYVFVVGETPSPDVRGSGAYLQTLTLTLGVVIVERSVNGSDIEFEHLRKALRERLFGWTPSQEHEPFWLGGGRLLSIKTHVASWLDNFVTEYTEDENQWRVKNEEN